MTSLSQQVSADANARHEDHGLTTPLISADAHVYERPEVWTKGVAKKLRHSLKLEKNELGDEVLVAAGLALPAFAKLLTRLELTSETRPPTKRLSTWTDDDVERFGSHGAWNMSSGLSFDPDQRIKDQDTDGLAAEIIYPSFGGFFFFIEDLDLQTACHRAYNDWLAAFCAHNPKRLNGIAMICVHDAHAAAKELERCKQLGLKGALIGCTPPRGDPPYSSGVYDPFWEAASELDMPVSMHISNDPRDPGPKQNLPTWMALAHVNIAWSIGEIVIGGALERFPGLKIVSVEADVAWMPPFIRRMDRYYHKYQSPIPKLPPSEYFDRVYATFVDEPIALAWQTFGADNFMWGGDYPHSDSTWPNSRKVIERDFADVPADVTRRMVCENAAMLYGIDVS